EDVNTEAIYAYDVTGEDGYIDAIAIQLTEEIDETSVSKFDITVNGYDVLNAFSVSGTELDVALDEEKLDDAAE
ncbi:hypothetical protein, partial [Chengkuizengella axinellae]